MALWGGRFSQGADSRFKQFNDSLRFDYRLAEQDIQGSMAWAKALVKVGVLTADEQGKLQQAMEVLLASVQQIPAESSIPTPKTFTPGSKVSSSPPSAILARSCILAARATIRLPPT